MRLLPVEKLALMVVGWAVLATASFFFHEIAFMISVIMLVNKALEFKFVYENTRITESDVIHDGTDAYDDSEQLRYMDPFPELGADWERSVRANLSEDEGRWNKRILG